MEKAKLERLTHKARNQWFTEFGMTKYVEDDDVIHHIPKKECELLLGRCHENASYLSHWLRDRGITAEIIHGGLNVRGTFPSTPEEASKNGQVHFWVSTEQYHVDMVSEPDGTITVSKEIPETYIAYRRLSGTRSSDSLFESNMDY